MLSVTLRCSAQRAEPRRATARGHSSFEARKSSRLRMTDNTDRARFHHALCRLLQRLEGVTNIWVQSRSARIEMRKNSRAHPWIPEFPDVFGDTRHRLVVALALKKLADLIGHVDQPVRRHERCPPRLFLM